MKYIQKIIHEGHQEARREKQKKLFFLISLCYFVSLVVQLFRVRS